jgi:hypothetical protein
MVNCQSDGAYPSRTEARIPLVSRIARIPPHSLARFARSALARGYAEPCRAKVLVGETGFEPATARPPAECATRLRHSPWGLHSDESARWRLPSPRRAAVAQR